jgi:hypothetical protein
METLPPHKAQSIAESIFGPTEWKDLFTGFRECVAKDLHTNRSTKSDLRIKLDGAPTAFCHHTSCASVIEEKNLLLRREIGKAQRGQDGNWKPYRPGPDDLRRQHERGQFQRLKLRAEKSLAQIVAAHSCDVADFWEWSSYRLDGDVVNDWRLHLRLYPPTDEVWIGELHQSGKPEHVRNFRTVSEWLKERTAPAPHICPNPFKPGVHSRTAENIAEARFLVVESDTLTKPESCAVLKWLSNILRMRAVVDTGGKSLHGWFEYPTTAALKELKVILPALKCDQGLFQLAHTCRLPGPMRDTGRRQHLTFLDLEGVQ